MSKEICHQFSIEECEFCPLYGIDDCQVVSSNLFSYGYDVIKKEVQPKPKNTLVVNLIGGSGVGKSRNASRLFTMLKDLGIETELVTEYVKDMVYEDRTLVFQCQDYIFGKQLFKLQRVNGKVDVIITDRPICLDMVYDPEQDEDFKKHSLRKFNQFNNLNILLNRVTPFSPVGRNENTIEEAIELDTKIEKALDKNDILYYKIDGNEEGCNEIIKMILTRLKE